MDYEPTDQAPDEAVLRLMDAIEQADVRGACPSCGEANPTWHAFPRMVGLPVIPASGKGFGAFGAYCSRCAFIRLHAAEGLDQYMRPH